MTTGLQIGLHYKMK